MPMVMYVLEKDVSYKLEFWEGGGGGSRGKKYLMAEGTGGAYL